MEGWLRDSFLFDVASPPTGLDHFKSHFKSVRDNSALTIELAKSTVKITTASMRVAADIVQDLASYLEVYVFCAISIMYTMHSWTNWNQLLIFRKKWIHFKKYCLMWMIIMQHALN